MCGITQSNVLYSLLLCFVFLSSRCTCVLCVCMCVWFFLFLLVRVLYAMLPEIQECLLVASIAKVA